MAAPGESLLHDDRARASGEILSQSPAGMRAFSCILALLAAAVVACMCGVGHGGPTLTPLDTYVQTYRNNPYYKYHLGGSQRGEVEGLGFTAYFYYMVSQKWLPDLNITTEPIWHHWVEVIVPDNRKYNTAVMYMDGGDTSDPVPRAADPLVVGMALSTQCVGVKLHQIPLEPLYFLDEMKRRTEDAILAYLWNHFLLNPDEPYYLGRMPMTLAGIKAMDMVQEVTAGLGAPVHNFIVAGASKRGWTTWTVAAVDAVTDKRIIGFVPIVMSLVQMEKNLNLHYQTYGGWSFALDDYTKENVTHFLNKPTFAQMAAIIDPAVYADRFVDIPKIMVTTTGDEFFIVDTIGIALEVMAGPMTWPRLVPNAEHSCAGHAGDIVETLAVWSQGVVLNKVINPRFSYTVATDKTNITVRLDAGSTRPAFVKVFRAWNPDARDFRFIKCWDIDHCLQPVFWLEEELTPLADGSYVAACEVPTQGYRGCMVELTWDLGYALPLNLRYMKSTTEAAIVPNVYPYPPCGDHC